MGHQLSSLSTRLHSEVSSILQRYPKYRQHLLSLLSRYHHDPTLSDQQILQWSAERFVSDLTNGDHEIGEYFLKRLAEVDLGNFDAPTITQCIAQAAMQALEGQTQRLREKQANTEWKTDISGDELSDRYAYGGSAVYPSIIPFHFT